MAETVIKTETIDRVVHYYVLRDGETIWHKAVAFSPRCPPAGAAFVLAAQEQERIAHEHERAGAPQYISHAKAAKQIGVTKQTIYRWEKLKMIPAPLRDRNGHRLFTTELIEQIKTFKNAGLQP